MSVCVFFTYFSFEFSRRWFVSKKKISILILPLPIENKRETNKRKTSISTIRSRQRKTTDCLLATALWFVSGSLSLTYNWTVLCMHVCMRACSVSCVLCIDIIRVDVVVAAAAAATVVIVVASAALFTIHTVRDVLVCCMWLCRELYQKILAVACCVLSNEPTRRQNERMHTSMRNTKNTHRMPISFRFLLFYFNISFLFHGFVCIAPDQTTQTKSTERVCARYMLRVFYAQAAIFTPFFLSGSIFSCDSEQLFNGNWTNEWWTSHRSVWMHYHMCVHTFVCCCAVCIGQ